MSKSAEERKSREPTPEEIEQARQHWAGLLGLPVETVPWEVVFLDTRPLTEEEEQGAVQVATDLGL